MREQAERFDEEPREACGVAGVILTDPEATNAAFIVESGIFALQHRGEEAAGIAVSDGSDLQIKKETGLVKQVFPNAAAIHGLGYARLAMAHTRWGTVATDDAFRAAQPHFFNGHNDLMLATAHNGEYTNVPDLAAHHGWGSVTYPTDSFFGSELIGHHYEQEKDLGRAVMAAATELEGSFSLLTMNQQELVACRDKNGFRPLVLGELANSAGYAFASETPALEVMEADFVRDVEPGEVITINSSGEIVSHYYAEANPKHCMLEYIYFARPDGKVNGVEVGAVHRRLGQKLAENCPREIDVVMGVPDSGIDAAFGFASMRPDVHHSNGLKRNRYSSRTYIQPNQQAQEAAARLKYQLEKAEVEGKRVLLIDDTVVNATTLRRLNSMLRAAGATEVHFGITSPPIQWPCYYGFENKDIRRLVANRPGDKWQIEREIATELEIDSLTYLTLEETVAGISLPLGKLCTACFTGKYPVPVDVNPYSVGTLNNSGI